VTWFNNGRGYTSMSSGRGSGKSTQQLEKVMKTLRKTAKVDLLVSLFEKVGDWVALEDVYSLTGIKNYNSLKAFCCYIRTAEHIPAANRIDLRLKDGKCVRVEYEH